MGYDMCRLVRGYRRCFSLKYEDGYQRFGGTRCLHLQDKYFCAKDEGNQFLLNVHGHEATL
jgi:hypothetical protein